VPTVEILDSEERAGYSTKIVGQQTQRPEGGIPERGPIPLHRDTTISIYDKGIDLEEI